MTPTILLFGVVSFILTFSIHLFIWRTSKPKNDIKELFLIFIFLPLLGGIGLWLVPYTEVTFRGLIEWYLLHFALSGVYIATYPVAQAVSPSLEILRIVGENMPQGLKKEEIVNHFDTTKLIGNRIDDLTSTRLIHRDGAKLSLSPLAETIIRFFIFYRKALKLNFKTG